jgi:diadenosine tetraphosphatase ApaH/serine/threonine PP2A family protein phosphatase
MRYLVVSDIHANLEAFEAVLAASAPAGYDRVLLLGDLVGYGADPNAVVDRVRAMADVVVIRGNHDKVASGVESVEGFNHMARLAIAWTSAALTDDNRQYLAALAEGPLDIDPHVEICHGTPFDEDVYVFDDLDALRSIRTSSRPVCLYGHTHVPAAFRLTGDELQLIGPPRGDQFRLTINDEGRYLVNCGSVGQPRDGDPRAAYGVLDTDAHALTIHRVPYDLATAQGKIIGAGLPEVLAQRLAMGR